MRCASMPSATRSLALRCHFRRILDDLEDPEQFADAADQQALLVDVDPDAGREREDDVVAGPDGHLDAGLAPPVAAAADGEHDAVLGGRLVRAGGDDEPGLAHA